MSFVYVFCCEASHDCAASKGSPPLCVLGGDTGGQASFSSLPMAARSLI